MSFQLSATLKGHEQDVKSLANYGTDKSYTIVSSSRDSTTRIWQTLNNTNSDSFIIFHSPTKSFVNSVTVFDIKNEQLVASGCQDAMIYLSSTKHDEIDQEGKYQLIGHEGNVCSISLSKNELVSSSWDATAIVWDLDAFVPRYILKGHESSVLDCKVLGEDRYLTCSADKTIRYWKGNKELKQLNGHQDVIRKLLVLPGTKNQFLSCSNDGTIILWSLDSGEILKRFHGHESFVYDLALLSDKYIISTGEDRTVRIWELSTGNVVQVITLPCISIWCVTVLPNGDFAVGGSDNEVRIFTTSSERVASQNELLEFKNSVESSSIAEQSLENLKKTDVPGYEALEKVGQTEGQTIMVKNSTGAIEAHQWSGGEWHKIGDVVGSSSSSKKVLHKGVEYDYVFDVDIKDGEPPLKLPYNTTDNPYLAAEKFLADNELPSSYTEEVVKFLETNTEGVSLKQEAYNSTTSDENSKNLDPYSDAYNRHNSKSLKVVPAKSYIFFKDFKIEQLVNGLKKLNSAQDATVKLSDESITSIENNLSTLTSKQAIEIIKDISNHIIHSWNSSSKLIGYDLLRISIPKVTTVDLINSTDVAEIILKNLNFGLEHISSHDNALLMMIVKCLINLIDTTLFMQLFIDPSEDGKQFQYNSIFQSIVGKVLKLVEKSDALSKLYSTTMNTVATFIYDLSVYQTVTAGLNCDPRTSAKSILYFIDQVGERLVNSSSEAAYRLIVGYGNFKYVRAVSKDEPVPTWISKASKSYLSKSEVRFVDLVSDLQNL